MPEISIIVPVYNAMRYLPQCIDSVINQSFEDWELLLVNDGSTDLSGRICHDYASTDKRITVIDKTNGGLSSARNTGLDKTAGKYFLFLDADDELYPDTLSTLHTAADTTGAAIAIGKAAWSDEKPARKHPRHKHPRIVDPEKLCSDTLYQKKGTDNGAWAKLYRRTLFDGLRYYDGWYEDLEIFTKLFLRAGQIAVIDSIVYFYRQHAGSFLNTWSDGRRDIIKVTEGIVSDMSLCHTSLLKAAGHRHFSAAFNLMIALMRHNPGDRTAIDRCFAIVKNLRRQVISDHNSRLKNRLAAVASYGGPATIKTLQWLISAF